MRWIGSTKLRIIHKALDLIMIRQIETLARIPLFRSPGRLAVTSTLLELSVRTTSLNLGTGSQRTIGTNEGNYAAHILGGTI